MQLLRSRFRQQFELEATHHDTHGRKAVHLQNLSAKLSRDVNLEKAFVHPSKSHGGIGRRHSSVTCSVASAQMLRVPEIVHRCESVQTARVVAQRCTARFARNHHETGDGAAAEFENLSPQVPQMQRNLLRIVQINAAHMQCSQSEWHDDDGSGSEREDSDNSENGIDEHSAQGRDIIAQTSIIAATIDTNKSNEFCRTNASDVSRRCNPEHNGPVLLRNMLEEISIATAFAQSSTYAHKLMRMRAHFLP